MKLTTKLMLWFSSISVVLAISLGYLGFERNRQLAFERYAIEIGKTTALLAAQFKEALIQVDTDLKVMTHLLPLSFNEPDHQLFLNSSALAPTLSQLSLVFSDFIGAHPEYLDISFITFANHGKEIVRVNKTEQGPTVVSESDLREKGHFPYVYKAEKLAPHDTYYSSVNIKQENSSLIAANNPSVKVSRPIYFADGHPVGVIVVNLALNTLFQSLKTASGSDADLYLAGPDGDMLIHPDPQKTFGLDKGHRFVIDQEFPQLRKFIASPQQSKIIDTLSDWSGTGYFASFHKLFLGKEADKNTYLMGIGVTRDRFISVINQMRQAAFEAGLIFGVIGLIVSYVLSRILTAPLNQVIYAIGQSSDLSRSRKLLPVDRKDEIGQLARTYDSMVERIDQQIQALQESEINLNAVLHATPSMIIIVDSRGQEVLFTNHLTRELLDISQNPERLNLLLTSLDANTGESLLQALKSHKQASAMELCLHDKREHLMWIMVSAIFIRYQNTDAILMACTDITEKKENENRITQLAFYDPLTNLPNRRLLIDRMQQSLAVARRHERFGALIFMDLDRFKFLNDTAGHHLGDELLIQAAGRIKAAIRDSDTAARLGGDEFVVVLDANCHSLQEAKVEATTVANKIRESLSESYQLTGTVHHCSSSMGIALYPDGQLQASDYIQQADTAMYLAKSGGGNTINMFEPGMQKSASVRLEMEKALRTAIEKNELTLNFQAQVDTQGEPFAAEALIRWHHPEKGWISPMTFIPIAEETGLIVQIGTWVLNTACRQMRQWMENGLSLTHISVNVSSRQFWQPDFVDLVKMAVNDSHLKPEHLMIELTEAIFIEDIEDAVSKMVELRDFGVSVAVDDFGTGYSSLSYLKKLPISQLKIDKSFVLDLPADTSNAVIVETIIAMAKNLKLSVVAEGVETQEQHLFLRSHGCFSYQGFYFSKPVSGEEFYSQWKKTQPEKSGISL